MKVNYTRRIAVAALMAASVSTGMPALADGHSKVQLRMATSGTETDQRSIAMANVFAPLVGTFASFEPSYNSTIFAQGTELDAISRGNLEMSITSAQELAQFFPEFSIFTAGYVHQDADHQVAVFNDPLMDPFKAKVENELGVKLLSVMYLGRRQVNLRQTKDELTVNKPSDLAGVNLRMPGTDAWQFLGKALGAAPTPMAFSEVYTALSTGAVDGQDNPLPTVVDKKFYEVTNQIVLTSHLVDLNYIAISAKTFNSMTAEQQVAVQAAADAAAASGRKIQLELEGSLVAFLEEQGMEVYEPDTAAFRNQVQSMYLDSEFAATWPAGVLEKVNALGK